MKISRSVVGLWLLSLFMESFLVIYAGEVEGEGESSGEPASLQNLEFNDSKAISSSKEVEKLKKILEEEGMAAVQANNPGIKLSGYVEASYTYNFIAAPSFNKIPLVFANPAISGLHGPAAAQPFVPAYPALPLRFTTDGIPGGAFNFNQLKVALEKPLTDENKWQAGFRVDMIFGQDAALGEPDAVMGIGNTFNTGSGFNSSGIFLEQAYVQFKAPIGDKSLEIHIGQFASPIGLEVMERPANFNFSYGILFNNFEPFTMVGGEVFYKFNDNWTTRWGLTNGGWNVSRAGYPYFGYTNNMINSGEGIVLFNMWDYTSKDKLFLNTFGYAFAPNSVNPPGFGSSPNGSYVGAYDIGGDIVPSAYNNNGLFMEFNDFGTWIPKFVKDQKLEFAYELVGGFSNRIGPSGIAQLGAPTQTALSIFPVNYPLYGFEGSTSFFGIAIYQIYKFNKVFSMAWREQYDHANRNQIFSDMLFPMNIYSVTVDWRFDLADNFMIRIENRADYGKGFMNWYYPAVGIAPATVGLNGNGLAQPSSGPFWFVAVDVVYSY